jgi:hypothetical protein
LGGKRVRLGWDEMFEEFYVKQNVRSAFIISEEEV